MTIVEAEMTSLEIANRLSDMLSALPGDAPPVARQALNEARDALRKAADALADAAEGQHRG